jgi:hypothetical protein
MTKLSFIYFQPIIRNTNKANHTRTTRATEHNTTQQMPLTDQELQTILGRWHSSPTFTRFRFSHSYFLCVVFCGSLTITIPSYVQYIAWLTYAVLIVWFLAANMIFFPVRSTRLLASLVPGLIYTLNYDWPFGISIRFVFLHYITRWKGSYRPETCDNPKIDLYISGVY